MRNSRWQICFMLLVLTGNIYAYNDPFAFRRMTIQEGLSNSNVNCFAQDSIGFIWIGTENGLNRFDGYSFTHYFSDVNKEGTLLSNEILSMLVDSEGILWVGTFQGLLRYNQLQDNFTEIEIDNINILNSNISVYCIHEDKKGYLWIGTAGNGLMKIDKHKGVIYHFYNQPSDASSLSSNYIFSINEDNEGNLWIGTTNNGMDQFNPRTEKFHNFKPVQNAVNQQNVNAVLKIFELNDSTFLTGTRGDGLFMFDRKTQTFKPYQIFCNKQFESLKPYEVYEIFEDSRQNLWISVQGKGLYKRRKDEEGFRLIEHENSSNNSLINNNVRSIMEDNQGNLWIASFQGGVNFLPNMISNFDSYKLENPASIYKSKTVSAITTDELGNIWVGTDGSGLKYIDKHNQNTQHFYPDNDVKKAIPGKVIMSLLLDDQNLWMGTYLGGLSKMDVNTKEFTNYKALDTPGSLSANFVTCLHKNRKGILWIGTNGGGLNRYNKESDDFTTFQVREDSSESSLINSYINSIAEDNNGRLWIGTFWGLSVFDPLNGMFINYLHPKNGLSSNTIYDILITSKNEVWLGTRNGLNKFIPERNSFDSYNLSDGLPGNVIYGIEEDTEGNLWISTNNGLCHLNTNTFQTKNYFDSDGLLSNEFFRHASHKDKNGLLYFGSINGLNSFDPENIQENYSIPLPQITQFRVFNQVVQPGDTIDGIKILSQPVYLTDTIILKQRLNSFAFEFSALDFVLPEKNRYRCKMEGFDNHWREMNYEQRFVTYTNLDAGTYTFRLKASSIEKQWNDSEKLVTIIITPPLYRTWWAYSVYCLLVVVVFLLTWRITLRRMNLRNQIKFERLERNKMKEINQAKLQFFTNISHEFRTPITLILGPLGKMMNDKTINKKYSDSIKLMIKNSNRLLRLINQLMDLRKVETGKMRLKTEKADIILFLLGIFDTFKQLAEEQHIDFKFITEMESKNIWFDPDKIDKIIFNLLSNAFKFTPEYGEIELIINETESDEHKKCLHITVKDSGKGIPKEEQNRVFERFFQSNNVSPFSSAGSGVGLSLTRSLIEQHYGEIHLNSTEGKGAEFIVSLPTDENIFSEDEKFSPQVARADEYLHREPADIKNEEIVLKPHTLKDQSILIAEDNPDLRLYLINELADFYNVYEATNGKEAFDIALEKVPDLIISDVLMPVMDGLDFCNRIKSHFLTNHIPVILLTARASIEYRIAGLEHGADSYIPKPFNLQHLHIRIKKLLELRNILKQKYMHKQAPLVSASVIEEDQYLKELNEYVLGKLDDLDLNIERICKDLGISRAHFYRKIKLMTDKSPTEYIRMIRLNEAAKLLQKGHFSVSEVGYKVGFNSPSYFSISFKEQYKLSPVEFVKRSRESKH